MAPRRMTTSGRAHEGFRSTVLGFFWNCYRRQISYPPALGAKMPPPTGKSPLHSKTKSPSPLPLPLLLLRLLLGLRRPLDHLAQELGQHVHVQRVPLRFRQQLQVPVGRQPGTTQPSNSAGPESKDQEKRLRYELALTSRGHCRGSRRTHARSCS